MPPFPIGYLFSSARTVWSSAPLLMLVTCTIASFSSYSPSATPIDEHFNSLKKNGCRKGFFSNQISRMILGKDRDFRPFFP
jgi:hypothetical protein